MPHRASVFATVSLIELKTTVTKRIPKQKNGDSKGRKVRISAMSGTTAGMAVEILG